MIYEKKPRQYAAEYLKLKTREEKNTSSDGSFVPNPQSSIARCVYACVNTHIITHSAAA